MASILVTGCEEDGTDQSANVASSLTFPRPPCAVCLRISRRVCTHHGGERSSEKSRLTCLAQVGGHPCPGTPPPRRAATRRDAYNDARRDLAHERNTQYVMVRDVIPTTTRRGHPCAIPLTSANDLRLTCYENMYLLLACDLFPKLFVVRLRFVLRFRAPFVSPYERLVTLGSKLSEITIPEWQNAKMAEANEYFIFFDCN